VSGAYDAVGRRREHGASLTAAHAGKGEHPPGIDTEAHGQPGSPGALGAQPLIEPVGGDQHPRLDPLEQSAKGSPLEGSLAAHVDERGSPAPETPAQHLHGTRAVVVCADGDEGVGRSDVPPGARKLARREAGTEALAQPAGVGIVGEAEATAQGQPILGPADEAVAQIGGMAGGYVRGA